MGYVYRYTDLSDNIIKYVGIVYGKKSTLEDRIRAHHAQDKWCYENTWKIEYLNVNIRTRTDAEYIESHFISLYGTDRYFNKAKAGWGTSDFLQIEDDWEPYISHTKSNTHNKKSTQKKTPAKSTLRSYISASKRKIRIYEAKIEKIQTLIEFLHSRDCTGYKRIDSENVCFYDQMELPQHIQCDTVDYAKYCGIDGSVTVFIKAERMKCDDYITYTTTNNYWNMLFDTSTAAMLITEEENLKRFIQIEKDYVRHDEYLLNYDFFQEMFPEIVR